MRVSKVAFNDTHAVASAGLLLPATLADRLGIQATADQLLRLPGSPGAHPGTKRCWATGCWPPRLLAATLAHNVLRWVAVLGLGARQELTCAKTLRRTLLAMPGRLTRSARRFWLHLPRDWPWARWFTMALARLRCIPFPA